MKRAHRWMLATTLGWALVAVASTDDPLGDALVAKFATCFEARGGTLSDDDRAVLAASGADLSQAAGITVNGVPCAGELPEGALRPSVEACAAAVDALACDGFAGDLTETNATLAALPPAPEWATTYVHALVGRTLDCYVAETGTAVSPEERARLDGFGSELASGIGAASSGGACTVHTDALTACTQWLGSRSCDALLADLNGMLGQTTAATSEASADTTTSADGIDVETADEGALDQRLAEAQTERQSTASQLLGPCAALVDCSSDLDATLDAQPASDDAER